MKTSLCQNGMVILVLVCLASCDFKCSVGGTDPEVWGPTVETPEIGVVTDAETVTTTTQIFYVSWMHPDVADGDTVGVQISSVNVPGVPPDRVFHAGDIEIDGLSNAGYFSFAYPPGGRISGRYRVDFNLNGSAFGSFEFDIVAATPGATPQPDPAHTP